MSIFHSEREMQTWLQDQLIAGKSLGDLIANPVFLENCEAEGQEQRAILESFEYCYSSLWCNELISADTNISQTKGEILRPDFLLYGAETESVLIVELKNANNATRQAGTEASAYAAEIRSYVPLISDGDVVNVIISTSWPVLLRHYIANEIIWSGRKIICLQPKQDCQSSITLEILDPAKIVPKSVEARISDLEIGGYQLCLYDNELYADPTNGERLVPFKQQMLTAMQAMSAKGNALRGHGFAFLWRDNLNHSLAPFSITVVNSAPFQGLRNLVREIKSATELSDIHLKFLSLLHEFDPAGHGNTLSAITDSARDMLSHFCSPQMEGFFAWQQLREIMLSRGELISFSSWGVFQDFHFANIRTAYLSGDTKLSFDDPDMGLNCVDSLVLPNTPYIDVGYLFEDEFEVIDDLPPELDDAVD